MATGTSHLLDCMICCERKAEKSPRSLTCLHSFCQSCLESLCQNQSETEPERNATATVECPVCRERTVLSDKGIGGLPLDFKVAEAMQLLAEATAKPRLCNVCKKEQACLLCKTCKERLCAQCAESHGDFSHGLVDEICAVHGSEVLFFCIECFSGLCSICKDDFSHAAHKVEPLDKGMKELKANMKKQLDDIHALVSAGNHFFELEHKMLMSEKPYLSDELVYTLKFCFDELRKDVTEALWAKHEEHKLANKKADDITKRFAIFYKESDFSSLSQLSSVLPILKQTKRHLVEFMADVPIPSCVSLSQIVADAVQKFIRSQNLSSNIKCLLQTSTPCCTFVKKKEWVVPEMSKIQEYPWQLVVGENGTASVLLLPQQKMRIYKLKDESGVEERCSHTAMTMHGGSKLFVSNEGSTGSLDNFANFQALEGSLRLEGSDKCIGLATQGDIYIYLFQNKIIGFKKNVKIFTRMGTAFRYISALPVGKFVVSNHNDHTIQIFSLTGELLRAVGGPGKGDGQFANPSGLAVMANGHFLVADQGNNRISEFSREGTFLSHVLAGDDAAAPLNVAYQYPHLWVLSDSRLGLFNCEMS